MNQSLIYDVGMHNGDDTAYYLSKGYKVISIEASPELVRKAEEKFGDAIRKGQLEILNIGITATEGIMPFYLNKRDSVWNSFHLGIANRGGAGYETVDIKTNSIDNIAREKGIPYYIKIDIEGNDLICLQSLTSLDTRPKFISAEFSRVDMISVMKNLGYTKFKLVDQFSLLPLELPPLEAYLNYNRNKGFVQSRNFSIRVIRKLFGKKISTLLLAKRQKLLGYDFPFGSSGTFGDHLPGKWQSFDEVIHLFDAYLDMHKKSGRDVGYNFWVDIHGTY